VGGRISRFREEKGMSLNALAEETKISKSYLWSLENDPTATRPSGDTLYKISQALGVTMSALLGKRLLTETPTTVPKGLKELADELSLTESDVRMLAAIQFRGDRPQTKERWRYIYNAIRTSKELTSRIKLEGGGVARRTARSGSAGFMSTRRPLRPPVKPGVWQKPTNLNVSC
jgi:transcriptional regulator with XRE-family HTH domain